METIINGKEGKWRVHTPNFLKEIIENSSPQAQRNGVLEKPINIFRKLLIEVGERASELNDKKLNALMCRLTIYEIANPESKEYNPELVDKIFKEAEDLGELTKAEEKRFCFLKDRILMDIDGLTGEEQEEFDSLKNRLEEGFRLLGDNKMSQELEENLLK